MTVTFDFNGHCVLVTGAARGIGLAIATRFAASGAQVWMVDVDADALKRAQVGPLADAHTATCDVRDSSAVNDLLARLVDRSGHVDVLVNNAGILRDRMLWKMSDAEWHDVIGVHLTGTFNCTRAVVPHMRVAGRGRVINITSYSGLHGIVGQTNYAAAKAGIIGFTRTAAKELAGFGITVNAVSPNAETDMVATIPESQRARLIEQIPLGRFGDPDEMASAVAFLATADAAYITGVVLPVDGGLQI